MQEIQAFADWFHIVMTILLVVITAAAIAVPVTVFTVKKKFLYASLFAALSGTSFIAAILISTIEPFSSSFNPEKTGLHTVQLYIALTVIIIQTLLSIGIVIVPGRK